MRHEGNFGPLELLDQGDDDLDEVDLRRTEVEDEVGLPAVDGGQPGREVGDVKSRANRPDPAIRRRNRAPEHGDDPRAEGANTSVN